MKIQVLNITKNITSIMRDIGYIENRYGSEPNFVRPFSAGGYPRFHIYPKKTENGFEFDLHLDAKKPIYKGVSAHNGEYDGEVINGESQRIKNILKISKTVKEILI